MVALKRIKSDHDSEGSRALLVVDDLIFMHEDCLKGNYKSIEKLRKFFPLMDAVSQSRRVISDDETDESSNEEASDMVDWSPSCLEWMLTCQPQTKCPMKDVHCCPQDKQRCEPNRRNFLTCFHFNECGDEMRCQVSVPPVTCHRPDLRSESWPFAESSCPRQCHSLRRTKSCW